MKNKALLLEAIENYSGYTPKQKKVLAALVTIAMDDIAIISVAELSKLLKLAKNTVYKSLKIFESSGVVFEVHDKPTQNAFKLNSIRLNEIIASYEKKAALCK